MLVIGRRENEKIHIGEDVVLTIVRIDGKTVRVAIDAPREVKIRREEIEKLDLPVPAPRVQAGAPLRARRRATTLVA